MIRLLVRNLGLCLCDRTVGRGGGSLGEGGFLAGSEIVAAGAAKRAESRRRSGEARVYSRGDLACCFSVAVLLAP